MTTRQSREPAGAALSGASRRRWWVLAVLCLSVLLVVADNAIISAARPAISRSLPASPPDLQWVVDAYALVFASLLLVGGNLSDGLGRRRILQAGLVLLAVGSAGAAVSGTTGELIGARAALGAAAALIYPATLALLTGTFTDIRERATAIGVWSAVSGLAVAIAPVGGGLLLHHFSRGPVFGVSVPVSAFALVAGTRLLSGSRQGQAGRFDPIGGLLSMAGAGLLIWTVIEASRHGWASPATLGGFAGSAAILAWFASCEACRDDPVPDLRPFRPTRASQPPPVSPPTRPDLSSPPPCRAGSLDGGVRAAGPV